MIQVVFSSSKNQSYDKYNLKQCTYNDKYKIYFEQEALQNAFNKLLNYECQECLKQQKAGQTKSSKRSTVIKVNTKDEPQQSDSRQNVHTKDNGQTSTRGLKEGPLNICDAEISQPNNSSVSQTRPREEKKALKFDSSGIAERIEEDGQGLLKRTEVVGNIFPDVFGLKNHLNYVHKLKLCDLCLTHNKLFPFEYSYYDYSALKKHMKVGELNTSHKGHPNCRLCHQTLFNSDELIQHMSREHFHCHLCGRHDSEMRIYFLSYENLRDHFKAQHFLCERDNCRYEQFTSAFDSMFDYQVHMVQVHGNSTSGLSRGGARQQRTITLDSAPHRARVISPSRSSRQNLPPNAAIVSTGTIATANSSRQQRPNERGRETIQVPQQRLPSRAEFPALGQSSSTTTTMQQPAPVTYTSTFPSLPQENPNPEPRPSTRTSATLSQRLVAGPSSSRPSFVRTMGGGYRPPEQLNEMDFPPLPEQPKTKTKPKNRKIIPQTEIVPRGLQFGDGGGMSLEELINTSLSLSEARNNRFKKPNSKGNTVKVNKNVKQKPIKIQLS